jgi:hypothetical protein
MTLLIYLAIIKLQGQIILNNQILNILKEEDNDRYKS